MATPIDIQTVYSQLNNVARTASLQQQAQLSEAMQQQNKIQKNLENSKKVQSTSNDKIASQQIKNERQGSSSGQNFQQKNESPEKDDDSLDINVSDVTHSDSYRDPRVGSIIDITR